MHSFVVSLQVVDHLLLGDEMRGLVDQRHEGVEFVRPVVEQVVGVFRPLEVDDASQPVDLGVDGLVHHEAGEEFLRLLPEYLNGCQASVFRNFQTTLLILIVNLEAQQHESLRDFPIGKL